MPDSLILLACILLAVGALVILSYSIPRLASLAYFRSRAEYDRVYLQQYFHMKNGETNAE